MKKQYETAKGILLANRDALNRLSDYLYEKETITGEEFMQILNQFPADDTPAEKEAVKIEPSEATGEPDDSATI